MSRFGLSHILDPNPVECKYRSFPFLALQKRPRKPDPLEREPNRHALGLLVERGSLSTLVEVGTSHLAYDGPMNILVLGGTRFVGRHIVEAALAQGHHVTTFTRGKSELIPGAEALVGDRDTNLEPLEGRSWDAVIDTSGYVPRIVRQSAELLAGHTQFYAFISTISVYQRSRTPISEDSGLQTLSDPAVEQITGETYGGLKVLCEAVVREVYPGRSSILRPTLVVGPHDPTDRFTYWIRRFREGGKVLLPGKPELGFQVIDARDLARFTLHTVEQQIAGTFNVVAPPYTWGSLVEALQAATGQQTQPIWADEAWLLEQKVAPWADLPAWIPQSAEDVGLMQIQPRRALAAGLTLHPLSQTVTDTVAWDATRSEPLKAGLKREREAELIAQLGQ